jgi:hypothetical protein
MTVPAPTRSRSSLSVCLLIANLATIKLSFRDAQPAPRLLVAPLLAMTGV